MSTPDRTSDEPAIVKTRDRGLGFILAAIAFFLLLLSALSRFDKAVVPSETVVGAQHGSTAPLTKRLGRVRPNELKSVTFDLKNTSNSKWTIASITPSCKCTNATAQTPDVLPGQSTRIDVTYKGGSQRSDDRATVVVRFAEPNVPPIVLAVEASIRPDLTIMPSHSSVGLIDENHDIPFSFIVENHTGKPWKSISASVQSKSMSLAQVNVIPMPSAAEADASVQSWKMEGAIQRIHEHDSRENNLAIRVTSIEGDGENATFMLSFRAEPSLVAIPSTVVIDGTREGQSAERRITIAAATEEIARSISSSEIKTEPSELFETRIAGRRGRFIDLVIVVPALPASDATVLKGRVTISLPNSTKPPLTIPVTCTLAGEKPAASN